MRILKQGKRFAAVMILIMFSLYAGCVQSWKPSDKEAVKLVRSHYLFYDNGESVQATIVERGQLLEFCDCYPITFKIVFSSGRESTKTFYFYRNDAGKVKANEFMGKIRS